MRPLVLAAILLCVVGCEAERYDPPDQTPPANQTALILRTGDLDPVTAAVLRVDDPDRGVTCYIFDGYEAGGIWCYRDTNIKPERDTNIKPEATE